MTIKVQPFTTAFRLNRKLADQFERLRTSGQRHTLGDYYIVNVYDNAILVHHVGSGGDLFVREKEGVNARQLIADVLDRMTVKGSRVARRSKSKSSSPTGLKAQGAER